MIITMGYGSQTTVVRTINMSVQRKNLRVCRVVDSSDVEYDVMIAVDDLDEVNNILQEWALDTLGETLDLPEALIYNKDIQEVLTTLSIDNFAYLQSAVSAYMDVPRYTGVSGDLPTFPTALVGGLYVMPEINAFLYSETDFSGYFGEYTIPTASFSLSAGSVNFIGVDFNDGSPEFVLYNSDSSFNYSSIIPIVAVLYFSSTIYNIPYGQMGYGLPEKIIEIMKKKQEFDVISTFTLATDGSNKIQLGALTAQRGTNEIDCEALDTNDVDVDMYLHYKDSGGVWQTSSVTAFNNTQYQSASGLASLGDGEYVVNYLYRMVSDTDKLLFSILSNKFTTEAAAKESEMLTELSDMIKESAVLVGRIVILKDSTSPVIQKVQRQSWGVVA